jgi:large subunit ribosomal protein L15
MGLHNFNPPAGSKTRKRRIARGIGSGMGKTATRGTKGQKARRQIHPNFEGGQSPIQRRLPVKKGFRNINHKEYAIVNLDDLENLFEEGAEVTPDLLLESGIISAGKDGVKVLAFGELNKKLSVTAHKFSKTASDAITAKGGTVTVLPTPKSGNPIKKEKGGEAVTQ